MLPKLAAGVGDHMLGRALTGDGQSQEVASEVVEILALDIVEVWRAIGMARGDVRVDMSRLATNLAQAGLARTLHVLMTRPQTSSGGGALATGMLYREMASTSDAGAELAGYLVDLMLWVLEDASNAPLAKEMRADSGFAHALWRSLASQKESEGALLHQLQQLSFGAREMRGVSEGPCYELRRDLLVACPALQGQSRR